MDLDLKITERTPDWEQNLLDLFVSQSLWNEVGLEAVNRISQRTDQGKGYQGRSLGEYSDGYKRKRAKAGKPIDRVYLQWDGTMMNSLTHKVLRSGVGLTAKTAEEEQKMRWLGIEGAGTNRKTFPFLGLSQQDLAEIQDIIDDHIERNT